MTIQELRNVIEQRKGKKEQLQKQILNTKHTYNKLQHKLHRLEDAREVIRIVGMKTQESLQYNISDLVSSALSSVYDDPYELVARFVQRRNKSECDLLFIRNGQEIEDPTDASGGGVINVASFALRVASWSMQSPRSNNVLILDEPFNNISVDLKTRASEMIQQLSKQLNLQIIMATHSEELIDVADKVFRVTKKNGVSNVSEA